MTPSPEQTKLKQSIQELEHALGFESKAAKDVFYFRGIAKSFEVCLEYAWKHLKGLVMQEGMEAYSPKEAIKQAGRLGKIDDVELWLDFLRDRNIAMHDYLGMTQDDYLKTIKAFLPEAKKLIQK